jgi:hypothetical protein
MVSTAHALATEAKSPLAMSHPKAALTTANDFELDFAGVGQVESMTATRFKRHSRRINANVD